MLDAGRQFEITGEFFGKGECFCGSGRSPGHAAIVDRAVADAPAQAGCRHRSQVRRDDASRKPRAAPALRPASRARYRTDRRATPAWPSRRMNRAVAGLCQPARSERRRRRAQATEYAVRRTGDDCIDNAGAPPKRRRQPPISSSRPAGGARLTVGVNCPAQQASPPACGSPAPRHARKRRVRLQPSAVDNFCPAPTPAAAAARSQPTPAARDDGARRAPQGQRFERQQGKVQASHNTVRSPGRGMGRISGRARPAAALEYAQAQTTLAGGQRDAQRRRRRLPAVAVDRHKQAKTGRFSAATCRRRKARASRPACGQAGRRQSRRWPATAPAPCRLPAGTHDDQPFRNHPAAAQRAHAAARAAPPAPASRRRRQLRQRCSNRLSSRGRRGRSGIR